MKTADEEAAALFAGMKLTPPVYVIAMAIHRFFMEGRGCYALDQQACAVIDGIYTMDALMQSINDELVKLDKSTNAKPQVDKYGNHPSTIAKLLRAFASGTATPKEQAAVFIVAADMLDPATPAPAINHRALLKDYMAAVLDYESITFVDKIDLSALSDVEHAELKAIQAEVVKEQETK